MKTNSLQTKSEEGVGVRGFGFTVDLFQDGVAFGRHKLNSGAGRTGGEQLLLGYEEATEVAKLKSRYVFHKDAPLMRFEEELIKLSRNGMLREARITLGVMSDPFHPFEKRFDFSMALLNLMERYQPGQIIIQTRSPLIVIALPILKRMHKNIVVTFPVETPNDEVSLRYLPSMPRPSERIKAIRTLRNFGIQVAIQVAPLLPYGDWRKDAAKFAEFIIHNSDYAIIRSIMQLASPKKLRESLLVKRLTADRQFFWLREDTTQPLLNAISKLGKTDSLNDLNIYTGPEQLKIFAA